MSKRGIAELALKLIGIYVIVQTIGSLLSSVLSFAVIASSYPRGTLIVLFLVPIAYIGFCLWFILKASFLASKIVLDEELNTPVTFSTNDVLAVAISCIGLLSLTGAIPPIARILASYYIFPSIKYGEIARQFIGPAWSELIDVSIRFIIGLYLFIWPKSLIAVLQRVRSWSNQEEKNGGKP